MSDVFRQGLWVSAQGIAAVFAALCLLWAFVALLGRLGATPGDAGEASVAGSGQADLSAVAQAGSEAVQSTHTDELARVAAAVAAAITGGKPVSPDVPPGNDWAELGSTGASPWVTGHRARSLRPWQPPRRSSSRGAIKEERRRP